MKFNKLENIPQGLKNLDKWLIYKLVFNEDKGKNEKQPYSAKTLSQNKWNKELSSYLIALEILNTSKGFNGLGFYLDNGITCIDLDNCFNEQKELKNYAKEILKDFEDTYIEISQSGKGLHIFCLSNTRNPLITEGLEIYSKNRYIAMTGNSFNNVNYLAFKSNEINKLYDKYFQKKQPQKQPKEQLNKQPKSNDLTTFKNDNKILVLSNSIKDENIKLLLEGKWESVISENGLNFTSQSEADLGLMLYLINKYKGNKEIVLKLFLSSGLAQRKKALREDYIKRTWEKAQEIYFFRETGLYYVDLRTPKPKNK